MPVTRFTLQVALVFTIGFTIYIGLIHLQPNDDEELRAFLSHDACPIPCVTMGMQIGKTTLAEAVSILEEHPWVDEIELEAFDNPSNYHDYGWLYWTWNGKQSKFINSNERGKIGLQWNRDDWTDTDAEKIILEGIQVETTVPLGRIWPLLNATEYGSVYVTSPSNFMVYAVTYLENNLSYGLNRASLCPVNAQSFWTAPVKLGVSIHLGVSLYIPPQKAIKLC